MYKIKEAQGFDNTLRYWLQKEVITPRVLKAKGENSITQISWLRGKVTDTY